eukprot:gnl/TRDRNA2_/TRDRNA2_173246_c0_seq3.p1 gnl/TRDRNA2_/TRDRNA2_173246_c0~~gnl/TRDRNA2_/TRDRNA2_173246_c0_seq3.p1  ORF type:complete len:879 (+),score=266.21 gnl/TRDRNA2_/TRDRNA2_173246_c0_seq3:75-2639(+)
MDEKMSEVSRKALEDTADLQARLKVYEEQEKDLAESSSRSAGVASEELRASQEEHAEARHCVDSLREELQEKENQMVEGQELLAQVRQQNEEKMREVVEKAKHRITDLSARLKSCEEKEATSAEGSTEAASEELRSLQEEAAEARQSGDALRTELQEREKQMAEDKEEAAEMKKQLETKMQEVIRKAKEHMTDLRSKLESSESRESENAKGSTKLVAELRAVKAEINESRSESASLSAELQSKQKLFSELQEDSGQARQDHDAKINEIVRKAKEQMRQLQSRLDATVAENKDANEKFAEVDEAYKQQQEKVVKYKQLMAQANARIEESDNNVRDLQEALNKSQQQRTTLQDKIESSERVQKSTTTPPTREEIARFGGVLLVVEGEGDDVWCLVNNPPAPSEDGISLPARCSRWWLASQIDTEEKPMPLQRRWKGEVSALRAQMARFKKKSEDLQEEFDTYRQKANMALQASGSHTEEIRMREKSLEQLGAQLQAMAGDLQRVEAELRRSQAELADSRQKLQEASRERLEMKNTLEVSMREGTQSREAAVEACKTTFARQQEQLEQRWKEKERALQQELDLRRAERESLGEEVEVLRARLLGKLSAPSPPPADAEGPAEVAEAAPAMLVPSEGAMPPPPPPPPLVSSGETAESLKMSLPVTQEYRLDGGDSSASDGGDNVSQSSYDHKASPLVNPKESPRSDSGRDSARSQPLPPQAYTLQASVAWQDLVNLRSQVRQLELSLNEEKHLHASSKKECEMARSEVREMELQRRLQNTVGQAQQMEYIRNVFRKFVETMPVGAAESEMLIPVLMSFFQISEEEAKEMKEKRKLCVAKSQGLFGSLSSWGASSAARSS